MTFDAMAAAGRLAGRLSRWRYRIHPCDVHGQRGDRVRL